MNRGPGRRADDQNASNDLDPISKSQKTGRALQGPRQTSKTYRLRSKKPFSRQAINEGKENACLGVSMHSQKDVRKIERPLNGIYGQNNELKTHTHLLKSEGQEQ